jgi:hypothetical protein
LVKGLWKDAPEIESAVIDRLGLLENGSDTAKGWRSAGSRKVVGPTLEYACRAIEGKGDQQPPPEVIANARKLAEMGFPASTLLRRYDASKSVFREHLRKVASSLKTRSADGFAGADRAIDCAFEKLLEVVEREHAQEERWLNTPHNARELRVIEQLLSGKLFYPPEDLGYDFSATHIGVVGSGPDADDEIRRLAQMLGGETLIVQASPDQFWAWIGLKLQSSAAGLDKALKRKLSPAVCIAIGGPAADLEEWCRTYREASAGFAVALHRPDALVRYADVGVLASIAGEPLLQQSLRTQFLDPLACERDGGRSLLETLRTYFAHDRHGVSTSAALGVNPQTITNRLRRVEECLGRSVTACGIGLEAAVLFADLTS